MSIPDFLRFCEDLIPVSNGQNMQDLFCLWRSGLPDQGYFVEFGALNGKDVSNSYLQETLGWQGIIAEPHPAYAELVHQNRNCHVSTECVWTTTGQDISFKAVKGRPALSTISSIQYDDHQGKLGHRDQYVEHQVKTISLVDLLRKFDAPRHIDFLSIDTEGSELDILQSFQFDEYQIGMIVVEHGFSSKREPLFSLLTGHGYNRVWTELSSHDDWYVHRTYADNTQGNLQRVKSLMVKMSLRDTSRNAVERYRRLAANAEASGYPEIAFRSALRAKELLPKNHLAEFEYAVKAAGLGHLREAILSCKKAIELNPGFKPAHKQLQQLLQ